MAPGANAIPVNASTTPGEPATGNVLDSAVAPPGTTLGIIGVKVAGYPTPIMPGSAPVPLVDPATGLVTGTLAIQPNGAYVFTPTHRGSYFPREAGVCSVVPASAYIHLRFLFPCLLQQPLHLLNTGRQLPAKYGL